MVCKTQKERHFTSVLLLIAKCLSIFSRVVPRDYSINFCFAYDSKRIRQNSIFLRIPLTRSFFLKDVGIVSKVSEFLLIKRLHRWEKKYIADCWAVGHHHYHTVDTKADTACRWHTDGKCIEEVFVCVVCFFVT